MRHAETDQPLAGLLVLDCSRMLPGAILARQLLDLGARVIKVEHPNGGDPMRQVQPQLAGVGAAFAALYPGAESLTLDLQQADDAARLRELSRHADVVVETFRPGTFERWGIGADRLLEMNPRLVYCSMSSWGQSGEAAGRVGHDLNFAAATGVLELVGSVGIPAIQIADVGAALLACSAILAALLRRERTGSGTVIDQPLVSGTAPMLAWAWADQAAGGGALHTLLSGRWPCYRRYTCGDGLEIVVSTIEPKFWFGFLSLLELQELAAAGVDDGEEGQQAIERITEALAARPRREWLEAFDAAGLPVSPVQSIEEARETGVLHQAGVAGTVVTSSGDRLSALGPFMPSFGSPTERPAPLLGEHGVLPGPNGDDE